MKHFYLKECSDHRVDLGVIVIEDDTPAEKLQNKIYSVKETLPDDWSCDELIAALNKAGIKCHLISPEANIEV